MLSRVTNIVSASDQYCVRKRRKTIFEGLLNILVRILVRNKKGFNVIQYLFGDIFMNHQNNGKIPIYIFEYWTEYFFFLENIHYNYDGMAAVSRNHTIAY